MVAALAKLPVEIISQIGGNLNKGRWLVDLALCSRTFYKIILPLIYSSIRLVSRRHLPSLATYLIKTPELAVCVTALAVNTAWSIPWARECDHPVHMVSEDVLAATERIKSSLVLSAQEKSSWIIALSSNNQDVYLALLLSLLPNIEHLDLTLAGEPGKFVEKLLRSVVNGEKLFENQATFSHLRVLVSNCEESHHGSSLIILPVYLSIPSLRQLHLGGFGSKTNTIAIADCMGELQPDFGQQLEMLEFSRDRINLGEFRETFTMSPNLKMFVYEDGWVMAAQVLVARHSYERL